MKSGERSASLELVTAAAAERTLLIQKKKINLQKKKCEIFYGVHSLQTPRSKQTLPDEDADHMSERRRNQNRPTALTSSPSQNSHHSCQSQLQVELWNNWFEVNVKEKLQDFKQRADGSLRGFFWFWFCGFSDHILSLDWSNIKMDQHGPTWRTSAGSSDRKQVMQPTNNKGLIKHRASGLNGSASFPRTGVKPSRQEGNT